MTSTVSADFDPLAPEQRRDPYCTYARARREQPVFYSETYGFWVVTRYDDVLAVLKDPATFSSVDALRSSPTELPAEVEAVLAEGWPEMPVIVESDPPLHTRIRGLINRAFTPRRIAASEPRVTAVAEELIDSFAGDGRADVIERFAWPLPLTVIGDMLGVPREKLPDLHRWSSHWLSLHQPGATIEQQLEWARSTVALQRYFMNALLDRRREPRDDLMTALLAAAEEGGEELSLVEVMGVPFDLIVAGHVTVTRALGSALVLLLRHPDQLAALREDQALMASAIEEIVRVESPAQGLFRRTTREVELGGSTLPAGARVMVHYGSANRDEAVFSNPDRFDVRREDHGKHIAFGRGIHFCLGAPLARLELRIALSMLLDRLPNLRFEEGSEPEYEDIFFARGLARLRLEWDSAGERAAG